MNNEFEAEVFFKCENFQRVGAFKFRGAMNALLQFNETQKKAGVVAFLREIMHKPLRFHQKFLVFLQPLSCLKMHLLQKWQQRENTAAILLNLIVTRKIGKNWKRDCRKNGLTLIPSYDHPHVIAGQGTAAKELFEEVGDLDYLFVCLGGGGLLAGSALSARQLSPNCKIYGVEPLLGNDGQMSFKKAKLFILIPHQPLPMARKLNI